MQAAAAGSGAPNERRKFSLALPTLNHAQGNPKYTGRAAARYSKWMY
jgi:hypothetical protein